MYMLGVQEYRSICCGVVCYVYSNGTYCLTTVIAVAARVLVAGVVAGVCCGIYTGVSVVWLCIYSSIIVSWHNIQKHNYILYVCIIY